MFFVFRSKKFLFCSFFCSSFGFVCIVVDSFCFLVSRLASSVYVLLQSFFLVNSSHTSLFARLHLLKRRRKGVGLLVLRACAWGRNGKLNLFRV